MLFARPTQHKEAIADSDLTVIVRAHRHKHRVSSQPTYSEYGHEKVTPALWGQCKDDEPPSAVASQDMPKHTMALDIYIPLNELSDEKLLEIQVAKFNPAELPSGKIPAVRKAEKTTFKLQTVETELRGHAHMPNVEAVAEGKDKREKWVKDLIKV